MTITDRTVHHLRLRAPNAHAARQAVHRLEDALRCASLPDARERLLLVRHLQLGPLPAGLSPQSLSLLIEQRVAAVGAEWVHGDDERAARSNTVFFDSRLQAAQRALLRRAQGLSLNAWHWPLALPGVAPDAAPAAWIQQTMGMLAAEPAAPLLLREWVADATRQGAAPWLLRHMDRASAQQLLVWVEAPRTAPMPMARGAQPLVPHAPHVLRDPLGQVHAVPRAAPPAIDWLPAVLRSARWSVAAPADRPRPAPVAAPPAREAGGAVPRARTRPGEVPPWLPGEVVLPLRAAPREGTSPVDGATTPTTAPVRARPSVPDTSHAAWDEGAVTRAGGLLFLLPVLERLGFAPWQKAQPERPMGAAILGEALRRLRAPQADPAWALVASLPHAPGRSVAEWALLPERCLAYVGAAHAFAGEHMVQHMAAHWLLAARRYLHRECRIGLAHLCLRPARLRWSATHLDVCFALGDADAGVRRWGLDIDPGWLPWLERVVAFEYRQGLPRATGEGR
ncbi:hypothetical protein [Hydrogenophaga sp. BPS33]|uniref:hypothetical protein n=1 Tax=Hydrogenophaga sp. BPS33 TaxID=2651974 RepID=UPI00131FF0FA|nr:hypothetical protein [Hydrogenophaga sp. BPS33]QHE85172.1 hypothetical protein F9K07_09870 [Hydrogenophaga sp. BPS33]